MESKRVEVELQVFFYRTNDDYDEPDLTDEELDAFMKNETIWAVEGPRFLHYAENVIYGGIIDMDLIDLEASYQDGGKIIFSFNLDGYRSKTLEEIKYDIIHQSFEDGMYEADPGSESVVPVRTYKEGRKSDELGLIDCRRDDCVQVKFI